MAISQSTPLDTLKFIQIIMVGTTLPANIGSAARAMHTMSLNNLTVVNPKRPIDQSSIANAAGGIEVLQKAKIVATLDEAIKNSTLILAASARNRHLPRPVITPNQAATLIDIHSKQAHPKQIAILFGREDRGLTNEELALADYHIQIPANIDYPVLNVASAIQVIAASLYAYFDEQSDHTDTQNSLTFTTRTDWDAPAITLAQKHALQTNLITLLTKLDLARSHELKDLPNRLSRLNSRLQLDQKEYALLQALIAKLCQKLS